MNRPWQLLCLILALSPLCSFASSFPQETIDLKADPVAHFGTLPNGLRYIIRPNLEPRERASLRLLVQTGSFNETENQRGLAHFLEHMAFNGSRHFPAGSLVEALQRLGMSFGADTNAHTGFDQTVYQLELPDAKESTLAEGFQIFADYAGSLDLSSEKIEKERGIILSEKRTLDSVSFRTMLAEMDFALGGTLIPNRLPIGVEDVIKQAPRSAFLDYYDTWYRPERMVVVAVGDFDAAKVEQQIKTAFASLVSRVPERKDAVLGSLSIPDGLRVRFHAEPEAAATSISLSTILPAAFEPDNAAMRLKYLPRSLALAMLNRRLSVLAKMEGAPFTVARTAVERQFDFYREASMSVTCKADQWSAALGVIEQELRRALEFGFQPAELKEAKANYLMGLRQAVKTAPTRRSSVLAEQITESVIARRVFTAPEDVLALYEPALERVTADECAVALRTLWSAPGRNLFVTGNLALPDHAGELITTAYGNSHALAVTAPDQIPEMTFAYADFGPAGRIAVRQDVADLGLTLVEFANGVRFNLKKTDFEQNRIHVSLRVGTGQLTEPRTQPGLSLLANSVFIAGGLGKHSADELQQVLAGKTVGTGFKVDSDAFTLGGATNREDLLLQCQLLNAYLTDPGYRPEAMRQAVKGIEQLYNGLKHAINGPLQTEVSRLLARGDSRFGIPSQAVLTSRTIDEVKAWLAPQLARGALEIAIAGDLDPESTIDIVARTFGTLPEREPRPALTAERQVAFPAEPLTKDYSVETKIPKGLVVLYWPTTDGFDVRRTRRLSLLAQVFSDRLRIKVREEMGGAYSPSAGISPSDTYPGYGFFVANLTVEPVQAEKIADAVRAIAADILAKGITDDELARAKQPLLTSLRESARTNSYWVNSVLAQAQEKPEVLDWCRTRMADNEAVTKEDLEALAKQYLSPNRANRIIILPTAANN